MGDLVNGLLLGMTAGSVAGAAFARWQARRMVRARAARMWRELQAAEAWEDSGLGAFGLPPLPATALTDTPSQLAEQLAVIRNAYEAYEQGMRPEQPGEQATAAEPRRYCPKCGGTPPGVAFLCDYHLARVKPSRAFVLALPSMVAHADGLFADDMN